MSTKIINIDPVRLSDQLCQDILSHYAARGKLHTDDRPNRYGIQVKYGKEGGPQQGKILFRFVTNADQLVALEFNVTSFVRNSAGYLAETINRLQTQIREHQQAKTPIILLPSTLSSAISAGIH